MTQAPSRGGGVACLGRGCADVTRPRCQGQAGLTPFHTRLKWNPLFRLAPPIAQVCPSRAERPAGALQDSHHLLPRRSWNNSALEGRGGSGTPCLRHLAAFLFFVRI